MSAKSPGLEVRLAAEIAESGPIPFARFMERALYDPEAGYYASGKCAIGKGGDFYTNVSVGPVYGEILAGQFVEMWEALGRPVGFTLVEQGAGDGQLARDVLGSLASTPLAGVPLILVEPSPVLRKEQAGKLVGHEVSWVADATDLPEICGAHYSNELFDALPVHLVRSTGDGWVGLHVGHANGAFVWRKMPVTGELADVVARFPLRPKGFTTEISLSHRPLLRALAGKISRGFLLVVDYGLTLGSLLAEHRTDGTLSCYRGHRRDSDPLESPGEKDLTAHVNFTLLAEDAVEAGWEFRHSTDQHHFLVGAATRLLHSLDGRLPNPDTGKKLRSLRTLLHPEGMGRQFQVILFSRGMGEANLSGFQHAAKSRMNLREDL
ncbi:MAG: SAM-dependent methyltransferase [Terrimicrobiaceae bacterium]